MVVWLDCVVGWLVGWLGGWLGGWFGVRWLASWLAGWFCWFVGCSNSYLYLGVWGRLLNGEIHMVVFIIIIRRIDFSEWSLWVYNRDKAAVVSFASSTHTWLHKVNLMGRGGGKSEGCGGRRGEEEKQDAERETLTRNEFAQNSAVQSRCIATGRQSPSNGRINRNASIGMLHGDKRAAHTCWHCQVEKLGRIDVEGLRNVLLGSKGTPPFTPSPLSLPGTDEVTRWQYGSARHHTSFSALRSRWPGRRRENPLEWRKVQNTDTT